MVQSELFKTYSITRCSTSSIIKGVTIINIRMKRMIFWNVFLDSIKLPRKKSLFKLNRTGMDIVVIYMFILLLFVSLPNLLQQIANKESLGLEIDAFFLIIYFFIFYYLPMLVIVFLLISLIAYIGLGITKLMKRKLRFAILWKLIAFTTTTPFALYAVLTIFLHINDAYLLISLLYTFVLLIKMISIFPKRRPRPIKK